MIPKLAASTYCTRQPGRFTARLCARGLPSAVPLLVVTLVASADGQASGPAVAIVALLVKGQPMVDGIVLSRVLRSAQGRQNRIFSMGPGPALTAATAATAAAQAQAPGQVSRLFGWTKEGAGRNCAIT